MSGLAEPPPGRVEAPPPPPTAPQVALELSVSPPLAAGILRAAPFAAWRGGRSRSAPTRVAWPDTPEGASAPGTTEPDTDLSDAHFDGFARTLPLVPGALHGVTVLEGEVRAGATVRPIARLTLRGEAATVFALAEALLESGCSVPARSLGGEMAALVRGPTAPAPPALQAGLTLDDAFANIVGALTATLLHHAPDAAAGIAPEPVHQMRVALRRLRSALSLFAKVAGGDALAQARRDLQGLARALGPARDWDVFVAGTGREAAQLLAGEPSLPRLLAGAERRRRAAYAELATLLDGPAFQRTMLDLTRLWMTRPWTPTDTRLPEFAHAALDRRLRRVLAAGDDLAVLPAGELHALRIQCKRLRYAAEFFAPLSSGRRARRFLRRLAAVQERLGQVNDGAVAAGLMRELGSRGFAAGLVVGVVAARTEGSRSKAERSWRKFLRTDPFWH